MKQPVYYRLINGNITDVTSMKTCVDELNAKDVIFIADKGFYSKKNVTDLKGSSVHFIIPLYRNNNLIDYEPLQKANFKKGIKNYFTYQKKVIWYYEYENEAPSVFDRVLSNKWMQLSDPLPENLKYPDINELFSKVSCKDIENRLKHVSAVNALSEEYETIFYNESNTENLKNRNI